MSTAQVATAAAALEPGGLIDGWRLDSLLHEGGTGRIYRVHAEAAPEPGFPVIMKAPPLGLGQPAIGIVSFEMEQMILATLTGPYVPRFVATGDSAATPYVAMEWIDGRSLADMQSLFPLASAEVARLGAAIADAVHSIHQQHVIHFDLKPENVLLRANGNAVLIDFGFARHAHARIFSPKSATSLPAPPPMSRGSNCSRTAPIRAATSSRSACCSTRWRRVRRLSASRARSRACVIGCGVRHVHRGALKTTCLAGSRR